MKLRLRLRAVSELVCSGRKIAAVAACILGLNLVSAGTVVGALSDGLQLHNTFDESNFSSPLLPTNTVVYDLAGPPPLQNGTISNNSGLSLGIGKIGGALDFTDSTSTNVSYGNIFDVGTEEISVSLWFSVDTSTAHNQILASRGANGSTSAGWAMTVVHHATDTNLDNALQFNLGPEGGVAILRTAGGFLQSDIWYHAALTLKKELDGTGTVTGYVNGSSAGISLSSGSNPLPNGYDIVPNATHPMRVGRRATSSTPTNGLIDDLGIWDRALSAAEVLDIYNNGVMGIALPSSLQNVAEWISTSTPDWGTAENWSLAAVPTGDYELVFRGASGSVNNADLSGVARSAAGLTFNGNGGDFDVTGLTVATPLTVDALMNSKTAADIKVTSGTHKIMGTGGLSTDPGIAGSSSTGDLVLGGISADDWFVVDIAANSSLDLRASVSQVTTTGRNARFVKQGLGTLTFSEQTQMDLRPSGTDEGGIYINEGTLEFAAEGARGNPFAPVYVASGATLEFKNDAGFDGVFGTDGSRGNRSLLKISGDGVNGNGAIYSSDGENLLQSGMNSGVTSGGVYGVGLMVIAGDSSIGVEAGSTLTLSHGITDYGDFTSIGAAGGSGVAGKLKKVGEGTLIFNANNDSDRYRYSQEITVDEGTFLVTSPTSSTNRMGAQVTLNTGGTGTTIVLPNVGDTNGLYIGQPVTFSDPVSGTISFPFNAIVAGIGTDGQTFRISELMTGANSAMDTVNVQFGAVTSALYTSPVIVEEEGTFGGTGRVEGSTVTVNGGTIAPGTSIGTLTVGNATIDGTLAIEFGDNAIDKLVVAGTLNIAETIFDFSAIGGLDEAVNNDTYVFATYQFLQGFTDVASLNVLNLPETLDIYHDEVNQYFSLIGSYTAGLPGDFNGDDVVDAGDYVIWRKDPTHPANGYVSDPSDGYNLWRANFGNSAGSGASLDSGSVPEPAIGALIVIGAGLLASGRRSRRQQLTENFAG